VLRIIPVHRFWVLFTLHFLLIALEGGLAMYVLADFSNSVADLRRIQAAGMQIDEFGLVLNNFVKEMKVSTGIAQDGLGAVPLPATATLGESAGSLADLQRAIGSEPLTRLLGGVADMREGIAAYGRQLRSGARDEATLTYIQTIEPLADRLMSADYPATRSAILAEVARVSESNRRSGVFAWRVLVASLAAALAVGLLLGRLIWATLRTAVAQERELERRASALESSLAEKELLLKEIHHRVKNNLQVITSLLKLESESVSDPRALRSFQESLGRVRSMALLHEKLYRSRDLGRVDLADYLRQLAVTLLEQNGIDPDRVHVAFEFDQVSISTDTAAPCGLIANELISNVLKYAFPGDRRGEITIGLRRCEGDSLLFTVADNGVGLPEDLDVWKTESLGLQLVILLVDQVHGTLRVDRTAGTRFEITFSNKEPPTRH
jgi:two-component sensor histidine kinase